MRIVHENTTALFIDFQERLFPVMNENDLLLKNTRILLEGLLILNIPAIFTQQYTKGLGPTIEELSSGVPDFSPIEKTDFSCYGAVDYRSYLEKNPSYGTIIICGIESHVCVLQTAVDLRENGYHPIVIADCVSSRKTEEKQIALNRFLSEGIRVSTAESILFELTRTAGTAEFKAISKLVK